MRREGEVAVHMAALLLYLHARSRSQLVTSAFLGRMGMSGRRQALSVALEGAVLLQDRGTRLLRSDVVVLIHRLETYYLVAVGQEAEGDVEPDESCCTCHQYLHRLLSVEVP